MEKCSSSASNPHQIEETFSEIEEFTDEEIDSDDEDPSYAIELDRAQSKLSKLSIGNKPCSRDGEVMEVGDEGLSSEKLSKEDLKNFEQVQNLIDGGQVEKLKVEQCKVYLRKHGLRLTGKKEILIQRIKEHLEIRNGGEEKYPPSSFVLNCKGDACLGDVVMFEQTVYEGFSIVSRSATGPPCGKRTIAGRIVNESYGAAKQQHTFTVEVLWSKGEKPLPPLHPLLIKGRNLYKLDTRRQRWEDEAERKRVLDEKHRRGTVARSNREARIQVKNAKKSLKGISRVHPKNKENSCHQKDSSTRETDQINLHISNKSRTNVQQQPNSNSVGSRYPLTRLDQPDILPASRFHQEPAYRSQSSYLSNGYYPRSLPVPVPRPPYTNRPNECYPERNPQTTATNANNKHSNGPWQRPGVRKLCPYYPRGRCYYGNQCKFLHE